MHSQHLRRKISTLRHYCSTWWYSKTHHTRWDSSGKGVSPSQRALSGNIQHFPERDEHGLAGFETTVPATELPQNQVSDHIAFYIGWLAKFSLITRIQESYSWQLYFRFQITNMWRHKMPKIIGFELYKTLRNNI